MRTFTLTLRCDNAAFDEDEPQEIARILVKAGEFVVDGYSHRLLLDANGNEVGSFELVTDEG